MSNKPYEVDTDVEDDNINDLEKYKFFVDDDGFLRARTESTVTLAREDLQKKEVAIQLSVLKAIHKELKIMNLYWAEASNFTIDEPEN